MSLKEASSTYVPNKRPIHLTWLCILNGLIFGLYFGPSLVALLSHPDILTYPGYFYYYVCSALSFLFIMISIYGMWTFHRWGLFLYTFSFLTFSIIAQILVRRFIIHVMPPPLIYLLGLPTIIMGFIYWSKMR